MITTIVRISYPNLVKPKENLSGVLKYSASFLIPKADKKGVKEFENTVAAAIQKGKETIWGGKVPNFRYDPIRDGDAELASGEKTDKSYEGMLFVNTSSSDPPGIVDQYGKPAFNEDLIYAGCWVRADINAFPFKNSGNSGVGWGLNNVMFIRDDVRLDGRQKAEDAFANFAEKDEEDSPDDTLL